MCKFSLSGVLLVCFVLYSLAEEALANTIHEGITDGGALIKIEVPDNWNGNLVIFNGGQQRRSSLQFLDRLHLFSCSKVMR